MAGAGVVLDDTDLCPRCLHPWFKHKPMDTGSNPDVWCEACDCKTKLFEGTRIYGREGIIMTGPDVPDLKEPLAPT